MNSGFGSSPRWRWLLTVLGFAAFAVGSLKAIAADSYPSKPARLIVPFGTGASTDIVARIFAQKLSEALGHTLVVENRPGSAGIVGTEVAARATPDGYTMLVFGINQTITPALYKKLPYDNARDFAFLSLYCTMPNILIVHPLVQAKTVNDFVAIVRASPGKFRYASSGVGATPHLTMELLKWIAKLDILHVPYKNASQGYVDLASGQLHAMFANLPGGLLNVRSGRLRALAVTSAKRAEQVPEVPTMIEMGFNDFEVTVWQGVAMPVATPKAIVDQAHAAMIKALNGGDLKQKFFDQGVVSAPMSRAEFEKFIRMERTRWTRVVKEAGVTLE
jgi:tripartite-type tricarboxylate transporter receptor subunit TctC